jgi:hypothetical protein
MNVTWLYRVFSCVIFLAALRSFLRLDAPSVGTVIPVHYLNSLAVLSHVTVIGESASRRLLSALESYEAEIDVADMPLVELPFCIGAVWHQDAE